VGTHLPIWVNGSYKEPIAGPEHEHPDWRNADEEDSSVDAFAGARGRDTLRLSHIETQFALLNRLHTKRDTDHETHHHRRHWPYRIETRDEAPRTKPPNRRGLSRTG